MEGPRRSCRRTVRVAVGLGIDGKKRSRGSWQSERKPDERWSCSPTRQQLACLIAFERGRRPEGALGAGEDKLVAIHLVQFDGAGSEVLRGGAASSLVMTRQTWKLPYSPARQQDLWGGNVRRNEELFLTGIGAASYRPDMKAAIFSRYWILRHTKIVRVSVVRTVLSFDKSGV